MHYYRYYNKIKRVESNIRKYVYEIFKVYGNELLLRLEDYNLLSDENNCIESSTATGFIIEEFITSKLKIYSQNHFFPENKVYKLNRSNISTTNSSYDCYSWDENLFVMINIKAEKNTSQNNGVAAINILYDDYVVKNPEIEKAYLVLKINYHFGYSEFDGQRKIFIDDVYSYFLEELDFSEEHRQDHRNWSTTFNKNSGRLLISNFFIKTHQLEKNLISYENTRKMLEKLVK